ncbi:MAG: aminoacyl-tRNA hydrolase [Kiritimatiellae bacterium]|nr:aminoacyl-tRNA hydrolase [Kiritimatiellia bacterium]
MKIVAGLGNPGAKYANTPHSVGFEVVDAIAARCGASWEEKRSFNCLMAKCDFGGVHVVLLKPQTFMNLSGDAVAPAVKYTNSSAADLLVVQDDIDLPLGRVRFRKGGSCGGHNGVRNIIERLGTQDFARLKLGVGKERGNVIGHVLGKFDGESRKLMDTIVSDAASMVEVFLSEGVDSAMNKFNSYGTGGR